MILICNNNLLFLILCIESRRTKLETFRKNILEVLQNLPDIIDNGNREDQCKLEDKTAKLLQDSPEICHTDKKRKPEKQLQQTFFKLRRKTEEAGPRGDDVDVEEAEECAALFRDWDWSSDTEWDTEDGETSGSSGTVTQPLIAKFYDGPGTCTTWNQWNYWRPASDPPSLQIDIGEEDCIAHEDPDAYDLVMTYPHGPFDLTRLRAEHNFNVFVDESNKVSHAKPKRRDKKKCFDEKLDKKEVCLSIFLLPEASLKRFSNFHQDQRNWCQSSRKYSVHKKRALMKLHPKQPRKQHHL